MVGVNVFGAGCKGQKMRERPSAQRGPRNSHSLCIQFQKIINKKMKIRMKKCIVIDCMIFNDSYLGMQ